MTNYKFENILCYGEVLWDMLPNGAQPGGAPVNVAIHLKKQGQNPVIVSKTGNDKEGIELIRFIEESGLDTNFIQIDNELKTSKVLIWLDKDKNATYEICEPVAWDNILFEDKIKDLVLKADLIIYGSLSSRNETTRETLFEILEMSEATRLLDVNLRPPFDKQETVEQLLHLSDFIKLNDFELEKIATWHNKSGKLSKLAGWLSEFYQCADVCVTRGENGALLLTGNKFYEHQGFKVNAIDTVGAGDAFLASLVAHLSQFHSPEKSLEYACATGAFVASQKGAVPNYSISEIETIIKSASV